jgi:hypothetical protein
VPGTLEILPPKTRTELPIDRFHSKNFCRPLSMNGRLEISLFSEAISVPSTLFAGSKPSETESHKQDFHASGSFPDRISTHPDKRSTRFRRQSVQFLKAGGLTRIARGGHLVAILSLPLSL